MLTKMIFNINFDVTKGMDVLIGKWEAEIKKNKNIHAEKGVYMRMREQRKESIELNFS